MYHASNYMACFGHDIVIYSSCDQNENSFSNFGDAYQIPEGMDHEDEDDELPKYMAGSFGFKVEEIEVF